MKLWVDADAAPRDVKEVIYRAARRLELATILVANGPLDVPANAVTVSTVHVAAGANVADRYIAESAADGDVAVTADIPLASTLVDKGGEVIDPRGDIYTPDNIRSRLATRDFFESVRAAGVQTSGARPYSPQDKKAFADALDRLLRKATRTAAKRAGGSS
jgi:uncharacterized protein YaiI (UPF0178 family)